MTLTLKRRLLGRTRIANTTRETYIFDLCGAAIRRAQELQRRGYSFQISAPCSAITARGRRLIQTVTIIGLSA